MCRQPPPPLLITTPSLMTEAINVAMFIRTLASVNRVDNDVWSLVVTVARVA